MENEEFQDKLNNSINNYLDNNKKSIKVFMILVKIAGIALLIFVGYFLLVGALFAFGGG